MEDETFQGTFNPIAHEQSFHDVLMRVMGAALRPADNVESYLVGPLLEFFCSWPLSVLLLHAEMALPHQQFQISYCSGATAETPDTSTVLKEPEIQALLLSLESAAEREARLKQLITVMSQPGNPRISSPKLFSSKGLVLWDAVRRKNGTLHIQEIWVVFEATIPPDPERLSWFFEKRTSRETLRLNLLALRAQRLIPELSQEIKALQGAESERLVDRLKRAEDLLQILLLEQAFHGPQAGYLGLAEDIGVWVVQLILGAGWVRRDFGGSLGRSRLQNIAGVLSEMHEHADAQCMTEAERLRCLSSLLQGLLDPRQEQAPLPNSDWQQLAIWTRLYELSRMAAQEGGNLSANAQATWLAQGHQSLRWLAGLLASRAPDGKQNHFGGDDLADSRNWLRLWFCHQLLGRVLSAPDLRATGTLRRQLQADLAYVLRECIRLRLFGRRPDYSFQPSEFAAALRTLIEYHSVYEVGLSPSHDIARLLYEIAEPQRPDQQAFAAAHLQHVLEMYIAGHFFCALEVLDPEQPEEQWTLGAMLAARDRLDRVPGPQTIADFRQAFSLAVLFHDVGLLLFPDLSPAAHPIYRDDRHLLGAQRAVQDTLIQAGRDLLNRCSDELRRAGWIDLSQDPDLSRWLEEQLDRGVPDHAILGAWYLHCTCRNVVGVNPEVVRDAVRAILLHGVPTRPILLDGDAQETDPVAALLVLCDEMLDWLPLLISGPAANTIGRSRHSLAADPRAYRSRARRLGLPQLQVQAEGETLRVSLALDAKARAEGWPTVDILLEPKEFQDVPIYQTWLSAAQNLQRIRRSPTGWGPVVRIFGEIPAQLRDSRIPGTRMLLEQVVRSPHARQLPFTASLEAWLSDDQRFPELAPEFAQRLREQCMMIRPEGKAFYTRNIRTWFPQMLEIVNRVLADAAHRHRDG